VKGSTNEILHLVSRRTLRASLGFALLIAAMSPTALHAATTGPSISNNTFASTPVGGSLTQTVTLTLTSAETIKSIAIQPGVPGATEYALSSVTGCTVDNATQSPVGTVCDLAVKFTPQLPGNTTSPTFARNATLLFTDSGGNVFAYGLTGAATGPVAKVVPGKISLYAGVAAMGLNALDLGLGSVTGGYGGDGGPSASATFNLTGVTSTNSLLTQPLALDGAGNLYVADVGNYIIRKIDNTSAHTVTTIAGTPMVTGTSAGSGGLAKNATLAFPHALVVDAAGDIYFIDTSSQYSSYGIVYRIDAATQIITAVGGQFYNPADGYNSAQGGGTCVATLGTPGYYECGDGGLAGYASLPSARNLAIDAAGNLYLWEYGGYIRKIAASTGIITTLATAADFPSDVSGTPSFSLGGMTLASDGNFYVLVDAGSYELIYELNTTTQAVTVVAGGQDPNYTGSCDSSGSVYGNASATAINVAEGQAGYPGPQLFLFTNGVVASTGDLSSDASGNIYYSGAQCNGADVYDYRPAVFRINIPTDTVYLETVGGDSGTATRNYGAYTGFSTAPASAIPDGNGDLYFTTNNQVAVVSASAGALDFGQQNEFTTGITRIATYENVGNATDTNPAYSLVSGLDFTDVSSTDTNACSLLTPVGVNKTCNIDYSFTPTQPNEITDTMDLAEATPGMNPGFGLTTSAQTVTLTGDANPEAQFVVTPASLSFGNVVVGQSSTLTFTVSNPGATTLGLYGIYVYPNGASTPPTEYTLGGTCDPSLSSVTVAAGTSCTVTVTFTPTTATSYPTTLTINNSVTNPEGATFAITGTGTSASTPTATLLPSTVAFGNQTVNTPSAGTSLTLSNTSSSTLNISGITLGGADPADFTYTKTCGATLAANTSCTITVIFKPASVAPFSATISVADDASGSPQTATLSGTGTAAATPTATLTPTTLSFGSETVNGTATAPALTLSNTSSVTLNISSIMIGGANPGDFAKTTTCGSTLAANTSCSITVTFTPLSSVPFNATVSVADNASGSPQTTTLSGTGTAAATATATLAPNPIVFPTVAVGTYSIGTATLTNTGTATLSNIVASFGGAGAAAFSTYPSGTCGSTLGAGDSCTFVLHFQPTAAGGYTATLSVADSANGSPQTIALSGVATPAPAPQMQFTPTELNVIAGTGTMPTNCVDPAEPGPALQTQLCGPTAVAVDLAGNVYIAEQSENVVKKLDTSGNITTFAGIENSGAGSYSGDNGPANAANLSQPLGVSVDGLGNVYISDSGNGRIRVVNATTGTITTFVGGASGTYFNGGTGTGVTLSPAGIAFDPSGNLYVAEPTQQIVVKVTSAGAASLFAGVQTAGGPGTAGYNGDNIQATSAELNAPTSVATDRSGNVYIADSQNYRIRYVNENAEAGLISTAAGDGTKGDTGDGGSATSAEISPLLIALNEGGDIFISDGTTIRKVDNQGNISTFAGGGTGGLGGPATSASLQGVGQPGVDNNGDVLIPVSGTPEVLSAGPTGILQFGSQAVGTTSSALTITVENTGNNFLNFTNSTYAASGDFSVTGGTCEEATDGGWAPGQTCTLTVTFTPTATSARTGSVKVPSNATGSPSTITFQGTGTMTTAPAAMLSPSTLSFGDTITGTKAPAQVITLSNPGNAVLDISGITVGGTNAADFAETTTCGETLAADASCTISVTFTPASVAGFAATVSVADNAAGSPQTVALSGAGIAAPDFSVSALPATQTVSAGSAATYNVSVASINGDFDSGVTLSASGLPAGATVTFAPAEVQPGSEPAASVMTVQTGTALARIEPPNAHRGWRWMPVVTMALCIPLLWWRRRDRVRLMSTGLLCALLCVGSAMLSGCGGGYYAESPAQTYTITVTGSSGSIQHSTTVTLTVQ
jgi:sugar lactone lactonase YvrE